MKYAVPVAFLILLLACACGKVGEPRPPKVRVPAGVADLKVAQTQNDVILTWTNPQRYTDGSMATDLTNVRIFQNGKFIASVPVSGPGKPQSYPVPFVAASGTTPIYSLQVETKRGKTSAVSNEFGITVVDAPGVVSKLRGAMDQHQIRLDWDPPVQNPSFAESYIVRRVDGAFPPISVTETHWEDRTVEVGKTYNYVVTAVRGVASPVSGTPSPPISVIAIDELEPAIPMGLQPPVVSDTGATIHWDRNTEEDMAGYNVYRSDNPNGGWVLLNATLITITSIPDTGYRPGTYYAISAVDESGNESAKSSPVSAP